MQDDLRHEVPLNRPGRTDVVFGLLQQCSNLLEVLEVLEYSCLEPLRTQPTLVSNCLFHLCPFLNKKMWRIAAIALPALHIGLFFVDVGTRNARLRTQRPDVKSLSSFAERQCPPMSRHRKGMWI